MDVTYIKELINISPLTIFSTSLVVFLGVLYIILKDRDIPPGPRGLPYLGLWPFLRNDDLHLQFANYMKKYGDVFSFTVMGRLFIHLGNYNSIKESHLTKGDCFIDRCSDYSILTILFDKGVSMLKAEEWKVLRRFFVQQFKEYGITTVKDWMSGPIYDSVNAAVESLKATKGSPINIISLLNEHSSGILRRMLFNDNEITDEELKGMLDAYQGSLSLFAGKKLILMGEFARIWRSKWRTLALTLAIATLVAITSVSYSRFDYIFEYLMNMNIVLAPERSNYAKFQVNRILGSESKIDYKILSLQTEKLIFPFLDGYKSALENHKIMKDYLAKIVRRHEKTFDKDSIRDIIDSYIKERNDRKEKGDPTARFFTEEALVSSLVQVVGDGTLSIAILMSFIIRGLLEYPEEQDKIYNEIQDVIGLDRKITLEDRSKLPYTNAFILELLRRNDFFTVFPTRICTKETTVNGYKIPKGSIALINMWTAQRDPNVFEEPDKFMPSRYMQEPGKPKAEAPVGFGLGKRSCVGESFTMMQIFLFVTTFVKNFHLEGPKGVDVEKVFVEGKMEIRAHPRKS